MRCEESVEIPAPPAVVWAVAQDPQRRPQWDVRVSQYRVEGLPGAGTAVSMVIRMGLLRPQAAGFLLRWDPPHQSVLQTRWTSSRLLPTGAGSWTFVATPTGTRLTSRFTLEAGHLPFWVPKWLYLVFARWDTRRSLRRLRRLVVAVQASSSGGPLPHPAQTAGR